MDKKRKPAGKDSATVNYDEYMLAMKRVHQRLSLITSLPTEMQTPRERHRAMSIQRKETLESEAGRSGKFQDVNHIGIIASMVPDEIIYKHHDYSIRIYETALMFIDVSGFTDLCENYTLGRGGPSRMTQVLNSYIGAMVQEILAHNGDVLRFSGDAFLSMWKKTSSLSMQDVVHTAIDCGIIIQKNYGTYVTDVGLVLKVKIAISAGVSHFSIVGGAGYSQSNFVIVGQPVWDVKMAEYLSSAGDVLTSASTWMYVNEAEYCTQPYGDGKHTKVLGVGATWKRVDKLHYSGIITKDTGKSPKAETDQETSLREFSLRPALVAAMSSTWWPGLRRFMVTPVLRAVDNDEPLEFLTEVRRVVVVFYNIVTRTMTESALINVVDNAYKCISSITSDSGGLVNKVSMFDKDMMFLVVFGLRGLKYEDETQKALESALQSKHKLTDENIISVSIGVTSGTTYCGVVGHALRKEYTVIGPAVNKAARLMMAYPGKVTCDKETFLRSKLDQENFRLLDTVPLKGITKPGPIYEFNKSGWRERAVNWRHPLLGRHEELSNFKAVLFNAINESKRNFTRYRDHQFGIVFSGPRLIGKTRTLGECFYIIPNNLRSEKICLSEPVKEPYGLFRILIGKIYSKSTRTLRDICEDIVRYSIDITCATPIQIYAINLIFDTRFPLPEYFKHNGDLLDESSVKKVLFIVLNNFFRYFMIFAVEEAQFADDESWRMIMLLLHWKLVFIVMTITSEEMNSEVAKKCLESNMLVKMPLVGVHKCFHAAIACQLLDVQAIPADLEKVIESASGGLPGWIQNFVISLVQRGALSVVSVKRSDAVRCGAVLPAHALLQRAVGDVADHPSVRSVHSYQSIYSMPSNTTDQHPATEATPGSEHIQMAVLADNYNFEDMAVDVSLDVVILKTYDALNPFEKMLLKCASVLGDVFSRRMLLHLLQSESHRTVAQAVAKLFAIRVLECEGGDFTRDSSKVLVHPAPAMYGVNPPYCTCLGTRQPANCRDLPLYAFCGYMKFRHTLFRTTTYDLLTAHQKLEMHARALMYLERYTRRCAACGSNCFVLLLGHKCQDGLIEEDEKLKLVRKQICALSAETKIPGELDTVSPFVQDSYVFNQESDLDILSQKTNVSKRDSVDSSELAPARKRVRSFSSLQLNKCECLTILLSVYCQIIDHCLGAGEYEKLYEAYIEYADLSVLHLNIPQAVRLLFEVENFVKTNKYYSSNNFRPWMIDFYLARIHSLRGLCMLESGDLVEAKAQLLQAMKLYSDPFPASKKAVKLRSLSASFRQMMAFYIVPSIYVATHSGFIGSFFENIATALNRLYIVFTASKEIENAMLAAKLSLQYALRTNSNFKLMCISYGNLIEIYRQRQNFSMCARLETRALDLCQRKRGKLDVTQIQSVCYLYTNIFQFYVENGKKKESLEFGLCVMNMMTNYIDLNTRHILIIWMLKLLLSDVKLSDMVAIMREFFYMTDYYDLSSETWYYYYAMVMLMDTGYSVESYATCERFYIKKGDAILRSKTPEAALNFFVAMWLITLRLGAWEKSILWQDKVKTIKTMKFERHEYSIMILAVLVEGLIINLVREMDNRNVRKIAVLEKFIKDLFKKMHQTFYCAPMHRPRYFLLLAYHRYIKGRTSTAFSYLKKASDEAKKFKHVPLSIWIEHTKRHWKGDLNPVSVDYWVQHADSDTMLDYRDYDTEKGTIIPYTLPLPREIEV